MKQKASRSNIFDISKKEALHNLDDLSFPYVLIGNLIKNSRIPTKHMWEGQLLQVMQNLQEVKSMVEKNIAQCFLLRTIQVGIWIKKLFFGPRNRVTPLNQNFTIRLTFLDHIVLKYL